MPYHEKPKRRIMRALKINEISAVDTPAQEGALSVLMKRNGQGDPVEKQTALLEGVDHSHLILLDDGYGPRTSGKTSWDEDHDHPWVTAEDGSIVVGGARGRDGVAHSHTVSITSKSADKEDDDMSDKDRIAELEAQNEWHQKVATLNDVEKAHFKGLSDEKQTEFLALSAEERASTAKAAAEEKEAEAEKSAGTDPVIYKASNGDEFRASDDVRLVNAARRADVAEKRADELSEKAADNDLTKRAEGLKYLPGNLAARKATLKAVDAIKDKDLRKQALDNLKAHNDSLASAFKSIGFSGEAATDEDNDPDSKLEKLAKAHVEKSGGSMEAAMDAVLSTPEGQAIYAEMDVPREEG